MDLARPFIRTNKNVQIECALCIFTALLSKRVRSQIATGKEKGIGGGWGVSCDVRQGEKGRERKERWFVGIERECRGRVGHSVALRCDVIRLSGTLTSRHTARCKADEDIMLVYSSCFPSSREFLEPTQRLRIAHLSLFHTPLPPPIQPAFVPTTFLLPRALIMSTIIRSPCLRICHLGSRFSHSFFLIIIHPGMRKYFDEIRMCKSFSFFFFSFI